MNKRIINIKSVRLFSLTICLLILLGSCKNSILNEEPLDFLTPELSYQTENGAHQGINALLARIRFHFYSYADFGPMLWSTIGSDEGYVGEDPASKSYLGSYKDNTPTARWVVTTWNAGFEIINIANNLIESLGQADPDQFTHGQDGINSYIAEAKFCRAWMYRYLVSTYGELPVLSAPVHEAKADFVREPIEKVYELMISDYKYATEYLPSPGKEAEPGRVTKGPAWHYLGEAYLEVKKADSAIWALDHVVNNFNYHLMTHRFGQNLDNDVFGEGDAYYDLFTNGNQNLSDNTEAMWVIQNEPFIEGGGMLQTAYIFGPRYFDIGGTPDGKKAFLGTIFNGSYTGYIDTFSRGTAEFRGTSLIYYDIWGAEEANDTRHKNYNMKKHIYSDNPESAYYGKPMDEWVHELGPDRPNMLDTTKIIWPAIHTKFLDPFNYPENPSLGGGGRTFKDWYALRFAETLLLRAEAYFDAGKLDSAVSDINLVRSRSNANPINVSDVDLDFILDERARELYGEEWRLVTLRRMGKFYERVKKYNDNPVFPGAEVQPFNILWPIPQNEIDLNSGHEFPQNDGY